MYDNNAIVVFSDSAYWLPTRKIILHGGQSRSWSAVQGGKRREKKKGKKSLVTHPPPLIYSRKRENVSKEIQPLVNEV